MEKQILITIAREYGSGGKEIATKVAEKLGLPLYDKNILETIFMDNSELAEKNSKYDEKAPTLGLYRHEKGMSSSPEEVVAQKEFAFIHDKAICGESFVVVGRCGASVLETFSSLTRIFICGNVEERIKRIMERNNVDEKQALKLIEKTDKEREIYNNKYSKAKWGKCSSYDLCINSSSLGIDESVQLIADYIAMDSAK